MNMNVKRKPKMFTNNFCPKVILQIINNRMFFRWA